MTVKKRIKILYAVIPTYLLFIGISTTVNAQIPDEFSNLQVFPKEISKGQLIGNMKSFTRGLGVRCQFCHVGEEGQPLSTFDFASDVKVTKQTARIMIQMRDEINDKFLTQLGEKMAHTLQVSCVTCHHGQSKPMTIEQVLTMEISENGLDAAIEKYRSLRKDLYGGFSYDFTDSPLNNLAMGLARKKQVDEAIGFLEVNIEFNPESWMAYYSLGEAHATKGENDAAIVNFKKSLEFMPNNPRAKKRIEQLSKQEK